jgi:hypothetical protein
MVSPVTRTTDAPFTMAWPTPRYACPSKTNENERKIIANKEELEADSKLQTPNKMDNIIMFESDKRMVLSVTRTTDAPFPMPWPTPRYACPYNPKQNECKILTNKEELEANSKLHTPKNWIKRILFVL